MNIDMTTETQELLEPLIEEANNKQLKLSDLGASATAQVVILGTGFPAESKLELDTKMGSAAHKVSAPLKNVPSITELIISNDFFEKNLVSGSLATTRYTVTTPGQNEAESPPLKLTVVR